MSRSFTNSVSRIAFSAASLALATGVAIVLGASSACQAATIQAFDNQFSGTWNTSDGNPITTYSPNNVGDTFTNNSDPNGATWTVTTLTPQPWSTGSVIFAGGGNATGAITTEFAIKKNHTYTVEWGTDRLGNPSTHSLTSTVYAGSGTGGTPLASQTLGIDQDSSFTFVSTGNVVTLEIVLNVGTPNASADIQLDYVSVSFVVPEPSTALLGLGFIGLAAMRRRRRNR